MSEQFSIIIVNWNSKKYLRRCLETIRTTCSELSPRVIVVDGASFDGCGVMLADEFPEVQFIQSPRNNGFGSCNNLGFAEVSSGNVMLLNPDTELSSGAVARLLQIMLKTPNAGVVAPRLLNSDGSLQTSCVQAFPTPLNQALDSNFLRRLFPKSHLWGTGVAFNTDEPVQVDVVSGACMLLKSEVFRKLGGFRSEFFMYWEDADLCYRASRAGLANVFVPDARVVHHGGCSSQSQVSGFSAVMMRVAGVMYFSLNEGALAAALYRALQAASAFARLMFLAFSLLLGSRHHRDEARASVRKWLLILRWALLNEKPAVARCSSVEDEIGGAFGNTQLEVK